MSPVLADGPAGTGLTAPWRPVSVAAWNYTRSGVWRVRLLADLSFPLRCYGSGPPDPIRFSGVTERGGLACRPRPPECTFTSPAHVKTTGNQRTVGT